MSSWNRKFALVAEKTANVIVYRAAIFATPDVMEWLVLKAMLPKLGALLLVPIWLFRLKCHVQNNGGVQ